MPTLGYREVEISIHGDQVVCDPPRAELYWEKGPDKVRWVYPTVPKKVAKLVIEWDPPNEKPCMYIRADRRDTLQSRRALVTVGNLKNRGVFKYRVLALDRHGTIVASCDPDVENQPTPP